MNFLSKVLEKGVVRQLVRYMNQQGIHDPLQSAYKNGHGVETALMKVKSDIDHALDQGDGVLLVLLDLSAAFDTIDHKRIISRLYEIGIRGTALNWFYT